MLIYSRHIGFNINKNLADAFNNIIDDRPRDFKPKTVYGVIRTVQIVEKPPINEWKLYLRAELKRIIEKEIEEKKKKDLEISI